MKTQLLEDIGENASLAPAAALLAGNSKSREAVLIPATVSVPLVEPEPEPIPSELDSVFDEIAALEAQLVPAVQQHEAEIVAAAPRPEATPEFAPDAAPIPAEHPHTLAVGPASRLLQPAGRPAQPVILPPPVHTGPLPQPALIPDDLAFIPDWVQRPSSPQDPVFDFTVPAQGSSAAEPFTRPPAGLTPSGRRYLLWGGCVLSVALLAVGGRWFYQDRSDVAAPALVASETKQVPLTVNREVIAANAAMQGPAEAQVVAAVQESRPVPDLPPLVMLEPDPPAATVNAPSPAPPAAPEENFVEPRPLSRPAAVAQRKPVAPVPKPSTRKPRERPLVAAAPAREKIKREPVRQPVRASPILAEMAAPQDTSMTATLKACREHGYGATQCVKRGCSLTRYGFACRGR